MTALPDVARTLATVIGIPVVPYAENGAIDHDRASALVRRQAEHGVSVLTANGNTGEFYALSPAERRRVLVSVVEGTLGTGTAVVAGVGFDVETARAEATLAREAGALAVMIHQPVVPYLSPAGWVEYNARVASAVPDLAVLPYLSSPRITGGDIARLIERCPNVVGAKYSVPDPVHFATVREETGAESFVWVAGLAESYAPAYWQAGATGFTSGLVNVAPDLSLRMLAALREGDAAAARRVWARIREFEGLRSRNAHADNVSVVKEAMSRLGLCRAEVRPPSAPVDAATRDAIDRILAGWQDDASVPPSRDGEGAAS